MSKEKDRFSSNINIRNRQATFDYELLDKYTCGIVLKGTEIKSIREGKANLQDGYCYLNNEEMFVKGISINAYFRYAFALSGAIGNLLAVAENYPQLKANENFRQLQEELTDIENKIAAARRFLNNAVAEYNASIQQFPAVLFAGAFGFQPAPMFELDAAEKAEDMTAPKVSFST